jgi:S1-C subfamily serine protease
MCIKMTTGFAALLQAFFLMLYDSPTAFTGISRAQTPSMQLRQTAALRAPGDFFIALQKPLGIVLEEVEVVGRGTRVASVAAGGSAAMGGLSLGDVVLAVYGTYFASQDSAMSILRHVDAGRRTG